MLYSGSQQTRKLLLSGTMHAVSISSLKRAGGWEDGMSSWVQEVNCWEVQGESWRSGCWPSYGERTGQRSDVGSTAFMANLTVKMSRLQLFKCSRHNQVNVNSEFLLKPPLQSSVLKSQPSSQGSFYLAFASGRSVSAAASRRQDSLLCDL